MAAPARLGRPVRARRPRYAALPAATPRAFACKTPCTTARPSPAQCRARPPRRADAPLRDARAGACWHPRETTRSAPPLRRGAAARQFPPSLSRCARQPLPRHSPTLGGLRAPQPPRGPQAPFTVPPGHYQSVMEALPPNLRCSPAQGLGVVVSKAFLFHAPPPWDAPRRRLGSGFRTPPCGGVFNRYRSRGGTKGTPVARPTSVGRPARGPVGDSLTQKTGSTR